MDVRSFTTSCNVVDRASTRRSFQATTVSGPCSRDAPDDPVGAVPTAGRAGPSAMRPVVRSTSQFEESLWPRPRPESERRSR
jgi:hypothetical protein